MIEPGNRPFPPFAPSSFRSWFVVVETTKVEKLGRNSSSSLGLCWTKITIFLVSTTMGLVLTDVFIVDGGLVVFRSFERRSSFFE